MSFHQGTTNMRPDGCPWKHYRDLATGFCKVCDNYCNPAKGLMVKCQRYCPEMLTSTFAPSSTTHTPAEVLSGAMNESSALTSSVSPIMIAILCIVTILSMAAVAGAIWKILLRRRKASASSDGGSCESGQGTPLAMSSLETALDSTTPLTQAHSDHTKQASPRGNTKGSGVHKKVHRNHNQAYEKVNPDESTDAATSPYSGTKNMMKEQSEVNKVPSEPRAAVSLTPVLHNGETAQNTPTTENGQNRETDYESGSYDFRSTVGYEEDTENAYPTRSFLYDKGPSTWVAKTRFPEHKDPDQ